MVVEVEVDVEAEVARSSDLEECCSLSLVLIRPSAEGDGAYGRCGEMED